MSAFLNRYDIFALPLPWGTIYYVDFAYHSPSIRKHELVHMAQIRREGVLTWLLKYFYFCFMVGYWDNPYEVEARRLSGTEPLGRYVDECADYFIRNLDMNEDNFIPGTTLEQEIVRSFNRKYSHAQS